jgi:hypothetical protein
MSSGKPRQPDCIHKQRGKRETCGATTHFPSTLHTRLHHQRLLPEYTYSGTAQNGSMCNLRGEDWIERRTQMHLLAKPDGRRSRLFQCSTEEVHEEEDAPPDTSSATPPAGGKFYHTENHIFCVGDPDKVDKFFGVQHYIAAWPKIPTEELHASSVQHPHHPDMRWLLHSRRVPTDVAQSDSPVLLDLESESGVSSPVRIPRSAGVGKEDECVWACFDCARNLCQNIPEMPPLALANWMWLGRVHHSIQKPHTRHAPAPWTRTAYDAKPILRKRSS